MPHYADGSPAKIGDRVVGRGYNVPHTISGIVTGVVEGSDSCNLRVAHLRAANVREANPEDKYELSKPTGHVINHGTGQGLFIDSVPLMLDVEYGDTKGFAKLPEPPG